MNFNNEVIVHEEEYYAKMPMALLLDKDVSDGAMRLFAYMRAKTQIPNWTFRRKAVLEELCISGPTYAKRLKNLEENHYLESRHNRIWKDEKGITRRSTAFHLYPNKNDHPALQNNNVNKHRYKHLNELMEQASKTPDDLYKKCKYLLDGYTFDIPHNAIDLKQPAYEHLRIKIDPNGYFLDNAETLHFNLDNAKSIWNYLWLNNLDQIFKYIKQKRR